VLFLDEIGDLAKNMQPKLLRLLDGYPFQPLGDERWVELKARVVAASHMDLEASVQQGSLREDLFYRLAVHVVRMPPLRERGEDVPELARTLLGRMRGRVGITDEAAALLAPQLWPGNVRQLANALGRLVVATAEDVIGADDVLALDHGGLSRCSATARSGLPDVARALESEQLAKGDAPSRDTGKSSPRTTPPRAQQRPERRRSSSRCAARPPLDGRSLHRARRAEQSQRKQTKRRHRKPRLAAFA
jgi:DNA-binding NtrC family response regulator